MKAPKNTKMVYKNGNTYFFFDLWIYKKCRLFLIKLFRMNTM